jgi:hypothetical protein
VIILNIWKNNPNVPNHHPYTIINTVEVNFSLDILFIFIRTSSPLRPPPSHIPGPLEEALQRGLK